MRRFGKRTFPLFLILVLLGSLLFDRNFSAASVLAEESTASVANISSQNTAVSSTALETRAPGPIPAISAASFPVDLTFVNGKLCVIFIDVGHGDSILIITPDQKTMLVDSGQWWAFEYIDSLLSQMGIVSLDAILATHPDKDHIGSFLSITAKNKPHIAYLSPVFKMEKHADFVEDIVQRNCEVNYLAAGSSFTFGDDLKYDMIAPVKQDYEDVNDMSIAFRMAYKHISFLMMGDAVSESITDIMNKYETELASTVLKAGHHGNPKSTTEDFFDAVSPAFMIISADPEEKHGKFSGKLLRQIEEMDVHVYQTYLDGTIIMVTDGMDIEISLFTG